MSRMPTIDRRTAGRPRRSSPVLLAALALAALAAVPGAAAGQEDHEHPGGEEGHVHAAAQGGDHEHAGLHFTHPMIAESVTPDTKVRLDHRFFDFPDGDVENSGVLEAEMAFHRTVSLEVGVPYSYTAGELGNVRALLKMANYALEGSGVLLGYGLGISFPTNGDPEAGPPTLQPDVRRGAEPRPAARASVAPSPPGPRFHGAAGGVESTLGTREWEVEPYLNVGYRGGAWEVTAWTRFAIPFRQEEQHDVGTELRWNLAALLHASSRLQALLELGGSGGISGHAVGDDVVFASPGLRFRPFDGRPLWIGTAVGIPVASGVEEDPFDLRWKTSLFWHFPR